MVGKVDGMFANDFKMSCMAIVDDSNDCTNCIQLCHHNCGKPHAIKLGIGDGYLRYLQPVELGKSEHQRTELPEDSHVISFPASLHLQSIISGMEPQHTKTSH